jgi:hypothetical protein
MRQFEQLRGTWDTDTLEPIGDIIETGDRGCGEDDLACRRSRP